MQCPAAAVLRQRPLCFLDLAVEEPNGSGNRPGGPPQRGQVDPVQPPDPHPRCHRRRPVGPDPRPSVWRGQVGRAQLYPGRHRRHHR
ncbi:hypothetical protein PSEUDO8AS_100069 [Pseudomonas sp. 8AS]|nr:hypothetical protein PSEUDO8AS_100069 [Pseudomonas sp. 8AS]